MNATTMTAGDAYTVSTASADDIAASRDAWNALVEQMPFPTPFATWEWVTTWQRQFDTATRPMVLFVRSGGRLVGVLPLARRAAGLGGSILELAGVAEVGADHADVIAAPDHAPACLVAIEAHLRTVGGWSELRLPLVTADSALHPGRSAFAPTLKKHVRQRTVAPFLPLRGTFEEYLKTLSSNERYKLRSRSRKLFALPGVAYRRFERDQRSQALGLLFDLHGKRSEDKEIVSSFARPEVGAFHRRLLESMPWDRVVLRGLCQGDKVFAMFYGFRVGGRLFYFQLGYDPAWAPHSPGLVLLTRTIEEAFDEGCTEYNFLQGDEPFKLTWTKQSRALHDCRVFSPGLAGLARCRWQHLRDAARRWRSAHLPNPQWHADGATSPGP